MTKPRDEAERIVRLWTAVLWDIQAGMYLASRHARRRFLGMLTAEDRPREVAAN